MLADAIPRRVAAVIAVAVLACLGCFALAIGAVRDRVDAGAAAESERLMAARLGDLRAALATVTNDHNHWTDAHRAMAARDLSWIAENHAVTAVSGTLFDGLVLLDGPIGAPLGWQEGSPSEPGPSFLPPDLLDRVRAEVARLPLGERETFDALAAVDGRLVLLSASRVQPLDGAEASRLVPASLAVAVMTNTFDATDAGAIVDALSLRGLAFVPARGPSVGALPGSAAALAARPGRRAPGRAGLGPAAPGQRRGAGHGAGARGGRLRLRRPGGARHPARPRAPPSPRPGGRGGRAAGAHRQPHGAPEPPGLHRGAGRPRPRGRGRGPVPRPQRLQAHQRQHGPRRGRPRDPRDGGAARGPGGRGLPPRPHRRRRVRGGAVGPRLRPPRGRVRRRHGGGDGAPLRGGGPPAAPSDRHRLRGAGGRRRAGGRPRAPGRPRHVRGQARGGKGRGVRRHDRRGHRRRPGRGAGAARRAGAPPGRDPGGLPAHRRCASGRLVRAEAPARWTSPLLGSVPPARFIPVAEQAGLILPLGRQVLLRVCEDLARHPAPRVSLDASPLQLMAPAFVADMAAEFAARGIEPSRVEVELTESVVVDDPAPAALRLTELHAAGFSTALDDIGTGCSSIGYLDQLSFDTAKIDRSFVSGQRASAERRALVRAMISLGHALGLRVVCEGVEQGADVEALARLGCDLLQGFHPDRPLGIDDLAARWLRAPAEPAVA